jgi:hypothetical protein
MNLSVLTLQLDSLLGKKIKIIKEKKKKGNLLVIKLYIIIAFKAKPCKRRVIPQ